ncbi:MAG: metal-sensitive transcriptional regulator [Actinomycetota bacterium]
MHKHEGHGSYADIKPDLLARLRRIEGQIRGVQKMIEQHTYCIDVIDQLSAAIAASEKVSLKVLDSHIKGCVTEAIGSRDRDAKLKELSLTLEKFVQVGASRVGSRKGSKTRSPLN